jgi:hypothetical protein
MKIQTQPVHTYLATPDKEARERLSRSLFELIDETNTWAGPHLHPRKVPYLLVNVLSVANTLRIQGKDEERIMAESVEVGSVLRFGARKGTPEYVHGMKGKAQNAAELLLTDRDLAMKVAGALIASVPERTAKELEESLKIVSYETGKAKMTVARRDQLQHQAKS